jgi:hypothetical protein
MNHALKNNIKYAGIIIIGIIAILLGTKQCGTITPPPPPQSAVDMGIPKDMTIDIKHVPDICRHEGVMSILAKLRRQCQNGICDITKLLDEANSLDKSSFITLIRQATGKTCFFYRKNKDVIEEEQWDEKKDLLLSTLTTDIANKKNTIAFIIAKASQKGKTTDNRKLSSERTGKMYNAIDTLLKTNNVNMKCEQIYRTYVGAELFQIYPEVLETQVSNKENQSACLFEKDKEDAKKYGEPLIDYVNQSVLVFTYPCFKEMCEYMKTGLHLSCEDIPDECKEINKCK